MVIVHDIDHVFSINAQVILRGNYFSLNHFNMRKYLVLSSLVVLAYACSNSSSSKEGQSAASPTAASSDYDSTKGIGKFTHIDLAPNLDSKLAVAGKSIYDLKCSACHKLTGEKLVGPGWSGVTQRRQPVWILNFVTNTDEMINKDPHAQALLEVCMVRMPNQNLSEQDARNVLEFMRQNDGVK
jgi:mono/diheme cytochrome c family protein